MAAVSPPGPTLNATEQKRKRQQRNAWEKLCDPTKGCATACCFYDGSPCTKLVFVDAKQQIGRCSIYEHRFGHRMTVAGKAFQCVPFHIAMRYHQVPPKCGYAGITAIDGKPVPWPEAEQPSPWGVPVVAGMA